ncbi:MAG TPA: superoxide dismutase [Bacteroidales bacterium]|nr:MAG: Superoxide dismutase (Mn/Fe) [Bacteroidetes bacterium ADurb.Bin037]HPV87837.1 superoxide dismutase [Bacteroidales bacterium]HPW78473.1 superoxide dismutase [Bacteroidales bacterium]HQB55899.1 superoxide dismutase [Bacteroidales bacterium]
MTHQLPPLPFSANDLDPAISSVTIGLHYGKHHQAYLNNLNNLIVGTPFENISLEAIIAKAPAGPIFNNAAQVFNHTFYFDQFKAQGKAKKRPENELLKAIEKSFGSYDKFVEAFSTSAATLFGSGWAWLIREQDGSLVITQESNAGCPLAKQQKPILTCDVWEHAYYMDYQNRRADYIKAFWDILDWAVIESRYRK